MKTAFISGASRGIGREIALRLAQEGYHIALCCRNSSTELEQFAREIVTEYSVEALTYVGNMGDPIFVKAMSDDILSHWGHVDVVINNAGISYVGLVTDMSVEEWNELIAVNLSSCFYTTQAFVPKMVHQKSGCIINISSMWGRVGASCEVAYSASKGGMNAYTMALAKELAPSNISVNAIACGVIDTQMNHFLNEEDKAALMEEIPAERFGTTTDVANTVISLLQAPSYLTGQIIGLDGGYI